VVPDDDDSIGNILWIKNAEQKNKLLNGKKIIEILLRLDDIKIPREPAR
jgi:hypothetical protein